MTELEHLVVSGVEIDKRLIAEILEPYVRLDKENCDIRPTEGWGRLSQEERILAYLIARKAMVALGFDLVAEGAKASEVVKATGVKSGTAHPALRNLFGNRIVGQSPDRRYFVPNHAIPLVKSMLCKKKAKKEHNG